MEHDPETHPIEPGFATRVFVSPRFNVTMVWCASEYLVYRDGRESSFEEAGVIRKGSDHYLVHVDVIDPVVAR